MEIKLDDLRPANTFERRLMEFLASGGTLPITVEHKGPDLSPLSTSVDELHARVCALEARPIAGEPQHMPVPTSSERGSADIKTRLDALEHRMAASERRHIEQIRAMQELAQILDDVRRDLDTVRLSDEIAREPLIPLSAAEAFARKKRAG